MADPGGGRLDGVWLAESLEKLNLATVENLFIGNRLEQGRQSGSASTTYSIRMLGTEASSCPPLQRQWQHFRWLGMA